MILFVSFQYLYIHINMSHIYQDLKQASYSSIFLKFIFLFPGTAPLLPMTDNICHVVQLILCSQMSQKRMVTSLISNVRLLYQNFIIMVYISVTPIAKIK